jgi:hypothetical protein
MGRERLNDDNTINDIRYRLGFLERHPDKKTNGKAVKIWTYILAFGFGVLLCWLLLGKSHQTITNTVTIIDTVYQDTGTHAVEYVPQSVYVYRTDTLWKSETIDTMAILEDYYAIRGYDSTIVDDSSMYIHYTEVISRNRSQGIVFTYKNKTPTSIITNTTIVKPSPKLYVSALVGGSNTSFLYGVGLQYQMDKLSVSGGYFINGKTAFVGVGVKVK